MADPIITAQNGTANRTAIVDVPTSDDGPPAQARGIYILGRQSDTTPLDVIAANPSVNRTALVEVPTTDDPDKMAQVLGVVILGDDTGGGGGGGQPWYFAPPTVAQMSDVFGTGVTTADDPDVGLTMSRTGLNSAPAGVGMPIPTPGQDWTATAHMQSGQISGNYFHTGLVVYDGAHNKYLIWTYDGRNILLGCRYNATVYDGYQTQFGVACAAPQWLRLQYVAATGVIHFQISYDGKLFGELDSHNFKTDLGGDPTFVGLTIINESNGGTAVINLMSVNQWVFTQ